jgi:hypothetical protein
MQIKKNEAVFEELLGFQVVGSRRDDGLVVTLAGARGIKMLHIDRNAKIVPLVPEDDRSMESIDRNKITFDNLIGSTVEAAIVIAGELKVMFLEGENPKGITLAIDAKVSIKRR